MLPEGERKNDRFAAAAEAGEAIDLRQFVREEDQRNIETALDAHPGIALTPAFQALGGKFDFGVLRLVRAVRGQARRVEAGR